MRLGLWVGPALAAALCVPALAQTPAPQALVQHTFEDTDHGWTAMGATARVSLTQAAGQAHSGKSALKFEYEVKKGDVSLALVPVPGGLPAATRSLRFWLKSDYASALIVVLQEQEARYIAPFFAPANAWQEVHLGADDFSLSDGENDPKDPNNKLDLDQVVAVGLADMGQIFVQGDPEMAAKILGIKPGPHTLFLDDVTLSSQPIAEIAGPDIVLDSFARPQLLWMPLGGCAATVVTDKPIAGKGLKLDYKQVTGTPAGAMRAIRAGKLAGAVRLKLTMASAKDAKVAVIIEQLGGGKFNTMADLTGGGEAKELDLPFSAFSPSDDTKDPGAKLTPEKIKSILLIDLAALMPGADQVNTLWLARLRGVRQ